MASTMWEAGKPLRFLGRSWFSTAAAPLARHVSSTIGTPACGVIKARSGCESSSKGKRPVAIAMTSSR